MYMYIRVCVNIIHLFPHTVYRTEPVANVFNRISTTIRTDTNPYTHITV